MIIPSDTRNWLLDAQEPYIRYQAQALLEPDRADRALLDVDPFIQENLRILAGWKDEVLERHDKPGLFMHRLAMLADLGVDRRTLSAGPIVASLLENFEKDGSFPINIRIPPVFGGTGDARPDWVICDFPVVLYALLKMAPDDVVMWPAVKKLEGLCGEEFYPCCGSIPKFKGPGPRGGMCPYGNLLSARALAADKETANSESARRAAMAILDLWTDRKKRKPFLFAMGTDFLKLKFPMVWFNLLSMVFALSGIDAVRQDPRFKELVSQLREKLDDRGRVKTESIYMIYKKEEWSNKKNPSRLMTVMVHRALRMAEES